MSTQRAKIVPAWDGVERSREVAHLDHEEEL
jgi:hypothetical protein